MRRKASGTVTPRVKPGWHPLRTRGMKPSAMSHEHYEIEHTDDEWKKQLSPAAYAVLRQHGTERAFTSPLEHEKVSGTYVCAACFLPLFNSAGKFDSGTGWPSFFQPISPERVDTRLDFKIVLPRTEYHCARCGGHQGHVFKDGPPPTGQRYCNNGVALRFIADGEPLPALRA